jgi:alpha-D-ribose 1-methylphosphonate 5-triphosphate synthase subunit PhnI
LILHPLVGVRLFKQAGTRMAYMDPIDWAKIYAEMDRRIFVKYEQLPSGEQIGKQPQARNQQQKFLSSVSKES